MRVVATRIGFYDLKRRRPGDVFEVHSEKEFSVKWMEKVQAESDALKYKSKNEGPRAAKAYSQTKSEDVI